MSEISPHLRLGNDALSRQAKHGVTPIEKPEPREKTPSRLSRNTEMRRGSSKPRRTPLGHASPEQKAKVAREGSRIPTDWLDERVDPAHVTPRPHGGCDHEDCVIGLTRRQHNLYDRGELDILPYLTLAEQAHTASHLGLLGALKRTTGETYVPQREGDQS